MTKEERDKAIDIFEHNWTRIVNGDYTEEELNTAISKALEALKAEPCDDCVSREAAVMAMREIQQEDIETYGCKIPEGFDATEAIKALMALPPVTPARKKGKWEMTIKDKSYYFYRCSCCDYKYPQMNGKYNFCPNCGAELEEK